MAIVGAIKAEKMSLMYSLSRLDAPTEGHQVPAGGLLCYVSPNAGAVPVVADRFMFQQYNLVNYLWFEENVTLPRSLAGQRVDCQVFTRLRGALGPRLRFGFLTQLTEAAGTHHIRQALFPLDPKVNRAAMKKLGTGAVSGIACTGQRRHASHGRGPVTMSDC